MKVALIYPPANDPRAPQLALPSLAAHLRLNGIAVDLIDANIKGLRYLLQPSLLQEATNAFRKIGRGRQPTSGRAPRDWVALGDHLAEEVDQALLTFADKEAFFDPHRLLDARRIVEMSLSLVCAAHRTAPIDYGLYPTRYDVAGVAGQRLSELIHVTESDEANLFAGHWQARLYDTIAQSNPDVVGITLTNRQQWLPGLTLARRLRSTGHFVILGGALLTKFADSLKRLPEFFRTFCDAAIVYEGETALAALLEESSGRRDFRRVPNLIYLEAGSVRATGIHIEDVRRLPPPDFAGLPLAEYLTPMPVLPILTGKGCYFNRCKFCDIPYINHVSRKAYRVRDPEQIAADIRSLEERFGARHFVITDEALSPKLLVKLSEALPDSTLTGYSFTGYARLEEGFTTEVCRRIARMGVRKLFFGLESGSQATNDHMDKGTQVAAAGSVLGACREAGIGFHIFSIVGFPEESFASMYETLHFFERHQRLIEHPGNTFDIHPFGLELRTSYFDDREQLGVVVDPSALDAEFVIGVAGAHWNNSRGSSAAVTEALIATEFEPRLRRIYRQYHAMAQHLWPGFEEYAVLYFGRFSEAAFPYTTSIEALDADKRFSLRRSSAFALRSSGGTDRYIGLGEPLQIPRAVNERLCREEPRTRVQLIHELLGESRGPEDARLLLSFAENLIAKGLLQVRLSEGCLASGPVKC